jgi:AbrB family looped-hinge helix DNA binding protein
MGYKILYQDKYMETCTINSKGQFTIPALIRRRLNLSQGDTLRLFVEEDGSLSVVPATGSIRDLCGALKRPGSKPVSIEEMNQAVAAAAAEHVMRHDRD